jgi:DNA-binding transcriptional ArsR family regulator
MCDGVRLVDEHIKRERAGAPAGPLGLAGDKIMRALHEAIDRLTGRLDVSYDWLCAKTGYSRPTIAKTLRALVEYGFLEIQRRCVRRDVAEGEPGPRWRQATNAYRMTLPALARRLLGLKGQGAPIPDDERDRRAQQGRVPERFAANTMGMSKWEAGGKLMAAGDPDRWNGVVANEQLIVDNKDVVTACRKAAAKVGKAVRCTIKVLGV